MAKKRADYRKQIAKLLKDGVGIIEAPDYNDLLDRALEVYSRKKTREVAIDVSGNGTSKFAVSALQGYDEEFSGDPKIEYPISDSDEEKFIDRRDWKFYRSPSGLEIRLLSAKPTASEQVRFTFKTLHIITENSSTVPESDFHAVCKLGAAEGFDDLSNHYTQTSENTFLQADQAVYGTRTDKYALRAKEMRAQANKHFGIKEESGVAAASSNKNFDTTNSLGGDRLTRGHRRRFR